MQKGRGLDKGGGAHGHKAVSAATKTDERRQAQPRGSAAATTRSEVSEERRDKRHAISLRAGVSTWTHTNLLRKRKQPQTKTRNHGYQGKGVGQGEISRQENIDTLLFIKESTRTHCGAQGTLLNTL